MLRGARRVAGASDEVVVDHAAGLHERVADRGAHKFETVSQERFAQRIAFGRARGDFAHGAAAMHQRTTADEGP